MQGKNISDPLGHRLVLHFFVLPTFHFDPRDEVVPHFDVICDLLLNRRTAKGNLLLNRNMECIFF